MNQCNKWSMVGLSAMAVAALAVNEVVPAAAQSGVPSQGGQPAAAPRPANSQPDPANGQPRAANPGQVVQPVLTPNQPTTPVQPGQVDPNNPNGVAPGAVPNRYQRPFAFQSPQYEGRFTESTRQLMAMEQRMGKSNQDLLKRLGEIRTLAPEKQNGALVEVVQQALLDQAQMQKYLVQARTAWSGEMDVPTAEANAGQSERFPTDPTGPNSPTNMRNPPQIPPR